MITLRSLDPFQIVGVTQKVLCPWYVMTWEGNVIVETISKGTRVTLVR